MNLDFQQNTATKDIQRVEDVEAVKRSVRNLINMNHYEKPFHPEVGSNLRGMLFENITPQMSHAISKEIQLLEEVWLRLSKNGAVAYGENELSKAMNEGAIETLLVSADTLRNPEAMIDGTPVSTWIQGISDIGAELVQCSSDHDSGEQLNNMGGVIALLRYRLV